MKIYFSTKIFLFKVLLILSNVLTVTIDIILDFSPLEGKGEEKGQGCQPEQEGFEYFCSENELRLGVPLCLET